MIGLEMGLIGALPSLLPDQKRLGLPAGAEGLLTCSLHGILTSIATSGKSDFLQGLSATALAN
jgi:hypothetical protein